MIIRSIRFTKNRDTGFHIVEKTPTQFDVFIQYAGFGKPSKMTSVSTLEEADALVSHMIERSNEQALDFG